MVVGRVGFMAWAEVKHAARATPVGRARAEHLAAGEPRDKHEFIGFRDVEVLAVHLFRLERDAITQPGGDRMPWGNHPEVLAVGGFAPFQVATGAHQALENLGEMPGVQDHHAHTLHDMGVNTLDNFVVDLVVRQVAPPEEHVRLLEHVNAEAMLGFIKGGGAHLEPGGAQGTGDGAVNPLWVDFRNFGVLLLVAVFVPNGDSGHDEQDTAHHKRRLAQVLNLTRLSLALEHGCSREMGLGETLTKNRCWPSAFGLWPTANRAIARAFVRCPHLWQHPWTRLRPTGCYDFQKMHFWGVPANWGEEEQAARTRVFYALVFLIVNLTGLFRISSEMMTLTLTLTTAQILWNAYGLPRRSAWLPNLNFFTHRVLLVLLLASTGGASGPFVVACYILLVASMVWYPDARSAVVNIIGYLIVLWLGSLLAMRLGSEVGWDHLVLHSLGLLTITYLMANPIITLNRDANMDPLTKVLNRRSGLRALEAWLREGQPFTLVFADLRDFKRINDEHGHAIGDEVLAAVAQELRQHVRSGDLVVRYGGDEFLLAIRGTADGVQSRLEASFEPGLVVSAGRLVVGVNIGVAQAPDEARELHSLLALADQRMYTHKSRLAGALSP